MAPAAAASPVFVDSSAWVALAHRRDQAHGRATALWAGIRGGRREVVTTGLVAAETHALLLGRIGADKATTALERLFARPNQRLIWCVEELAGAAVERWLKQYRDHEFSIADAVSFEVMRREGIREAFTFEADFRRAGFQILK